MMEQPDKPTGLGVDAAGGPVVDPTANVIALQKASAERQDDLRELNDRRIDAEIRVIQMQVKGLAEVSQLRAEYAREIRLLESDRLDKIRQVDVLAGNTAADRALVAIQTLATSQAAAAETLRSMVTSTASTIATQTTQTMNAVTERIAALEKSSYEGAGKQAVADPMIAEAVAEMKRITQVIASGSGQSQGAKNTVVYIVIAIGMLVSLITIGSVVIAIAYAIRG